MLRSLFVFLSKQHWAQRLITRWGFAWRLASRFVAGETLEEAMQAVEGLARDGINASLDHLGEHTTSLEEARQAVSEILRILNEIQRRGLPANVSIKLSQIGALLDSEECYQNLVTILENARARDNFVRVDMEDSHLTQLTMDLFLRALADGYDNAGIVLQSYLYRTDADLERVMAQGARVRMVKGAYLEPRSLAYPSKKEVNAAFDRQVERLLGATQKAGCPALSSDGRVPPVLAVASHDPKRVEFARQTAARLEIPAEALEFQMLYGIRRDLQQQLAKDGYPVRVYVPFGTRWYPYLMRRLGERPANLWFTLSNFFRK